MVTPVVGLIAAYLVGAIPTAYLVGRATKGIDLREHGSGNLGATNAFRVLGPRLAVPILAVDMLKGFLPTALLPVVIAGVPWEWALGYGAAAVLGHVFPIYLRFRGGKGVATAAGVFLALAPVAVGVAFLAWAVTLWLGRMVSLASISAALALAVFLIAVEGRVVVVALGVAIALFVIAAHRENVRRILTGTETRIG